jgi:tetratricopeptide (TPR) repeat protein
VRRAIIAFEKALSLDPTMAAAWARLSLALWWSNDLNTPDAANARRRAIAAAERSVALAPSLADGYAARSRMLNDFLWDFAGADKDEARALALAPNSPLVLVIHCINRRARGRFAESADACRRAIELDPLTVSGRNQLTFTYLVSGEIAKARAVNSRALEISLASQAAQFNRCALDILEGSRVGARDHCASLADEEDRLVGRAMMSQEWGTSVEAQQSLAVFVARFGEEDPATAADLFAWRGDADRAFEWLERAYDRHVGLSGIKGDWALQKIRSDARYAALLKKMRLPPN